MNIKIIEYTYPIFVISVIYLICDLRHTNNLQDVALDEVTKSLPLLVRTNINSYHDNKNSNKIKSESENLNHESVHNEDDDLHQVTMMEDTVHHDETKREKSMSMNDSVSTTVSHINYDKNRYGYDVSSMIPTHDYRKSFDAALRIKNNEKTMKEIWPKQNLFPNKSHRVIENQELIGDDSWKKLKQRQKQGLQGRNDQLKRNIESRKLNNDNVSTTIRRLENNLKSGNGPQKKSSEGIETANVVKKRRVESFMNEAYVSKTSCVLTKADVIYACDDDKYDDCSKWSLDGYCTNSTFMSNEDGTYKDWMVENCRRSCDSCPSPVFLLDSQIQYTDDNSASTFNLSLDVTTDNYASETSWTFLSQNSEDSTIFDSNEVNITSELANNAEYKFNYYCTIPPTKENQETYDKSSTCYNFEVHDTFGDGAGFFSMSLSSINNKTLDVSNEFDYGSVMITSFCLDHDDGDIESEERFIIDGEDEVSEELTDYPSLTPTDQPSHNLESYTTDTNQYLTICTVTKAEIISPCDDYEYYSCGFRASIGDCSNPDEKDWMDENCQKSCNACPTLPSLENQIQHEEDEIIVATFNLSLNVNTDGYANETSWFLFPKDGENSTIFNSSETNTTSQLVNNELHVIQYNCIISQIEEGKNEFSDDETARSICYDFEVHDSFGDGMCCKYGDGFFSMNVTTESTGLQISDDNESFSVVKTSFCIGHDSGTIGSEGISIIKKEQTFFHYHFRWQCKNGACLCDSKPDLSVNIHENHNFLLEVTMFSDSDQLQDVESAQYKAACWVLYDDPYNYYDVVDEGDNKKMIQRYILAVFYFATSPEKWEEHYDFLSSRSECDWNYFNYRNEFSGISCNDGGNIIEINLDRNNLGGTIVDELTGLRMLEYLYLGGNDLKGTIPPTLGRLSELRSLDLEGNDLEGIIPSVLGRLSQLHYLILGGNNLEATIPSVLGRLSELRGLYLRGNTLEGTIPPQLFNATSLEKLDLSGNRLEGTITETIGKLQKLSYLDLGGNDLSGSIPDALYMLKNLEILDLNDNKLSSSISPLIGNLNKLWRLYLQDNMLSGSIPSAMGNMTSLWRLYLQDNRLTGSIPSTIGNITSLWRLYLNNNTLSGPIPESLFDLPNLDTLRIQDNSVTGSVPNDFCYGINVEADCQNDVFEPDVRCSCCLCTDESPILDGKCADSTIKVVIDHYIGSYSKYLEWSLTNDATGKKVLHDGPYFSLVGLESYEACVAYSDCFSFNKIAPPRWDTNYTIYWNDADESIHSGKFLGYKDYDDINKDDPLQTLLSFQYNKENQRLASCSEIEFICGEKEQPINLKPNTTKRIIYNEAIKIFGKTTIHETYSPQSKALCWILNNNPYDNKTDISETDIIQRYVLTILHVTSPDGLFRNHDYPPNTHECDWNGITCKDNDTNIVTGISLSNHIINGTIIEELGSLKYLESLDLSKTQLYGSIPRSFSNLWSLKELNLSGNKIDGTITAILFHQLSKLEYVNLSDNSLGGTINEDIGSYSNIYFLSLSKNKLTGPLPLDKFKHRELEHLDIGENELSEVDFPLLLEHKKLNFLDISSNFFVGSLHEDTFISLSQLKYFNISQNDFSGTIPTTFPNLSNITHFDAHANKLKGTIPLGITELRSIQHLNLQGNKLTGSLPSELNQLKSLDTLALGHNELKGSIPFNEKNLQNLKSLHLQKNKLEGEAPRFSNMTYYITDCGFPSDSLDKVSCSTCNICCNSDGGCQSKVSEDLSQMYLTLIFMFPIVGFIILCYALKDRITSNKYLASFFEEKVKNWNALMLISDKSVYHFLLIDNKTEWYVAVVCGIFQTATLFLFVQSADMVNDTSDRQYFMLCPANSLKCENLNKVSPYGIFIFGLILTIWLLRDIIGSVKLMLVSFEKRNIDFFFTSAVVFSVTMLSLWTSIIYIDAIAAKNTDMIKDAVVLLFVLEIDERIFQLAESVNPDWVHAIDRNMRNSLVYEGKNLIISSWLKKYSESFNSLSKIIRRRNDVPPRLDSEVLVEDENRVVRRDESNP